MQPFANPFLFNAHALPVDGNEPHAQVGNHLRVNTHPGLGLPVAPFIVRRAQIDNLKLLNTRSDALFFDKNDAPLTPPFNVTPDNPAYARIVLDKTKGETCIWAQVDAISGDEQQGEVPSGGGGAVLNPTGLAAVRRAATTDRRIAGSVTSSMLSRLRVASTPNRLAPINRLPDIRLPDIRVPDIRLPDIVVEPASRKLVCEAFIDSAMGPASIGVRSERRWAFSGPGIVEIHFRGHGRVARVQWIEAHDPQRLKYEPYAILNLPTETGLRYISVVDPVRVARDRVDLQAPKRRPLQDTAGAPAPASAPIFSQPEERDRVQALAPTLLGDLDRLVNDAPEPFDQHIVETILDENGNPVGQSDMARLHRVAQAQGDPGTATFLGYKLRDEDWRETEERLIFYQIDGFFRDWPGLTPNRTIEDFFLDAAVARLPADSRNWNKDILVEAVQSGFSGIPDAKIDPERLRRFRNESDFFAAGTVAVADRGAPLDPPANPRITAATHQVWLPETPPAAKREVIVDCAGVRIAGLLAAGKRTPATGGGGAYAAINKATTNGWRLPLVLGINVDDGTGEPISEPGTGFIADRTADAPAIRYFLAQQDRFGRFSGWASRDAAPGPRPRPPRPHFQATYTQPAIADAATTGGMVAIKVPVPDVDALAPGSRLLKDIVFDILDKTTLLTNTLTVAEATKQTLAGDPTTFYLLIDYNGPVLAPTETRELRLIARWRDTANVESADSEPQTVRMHDPRPPVPVPVPDKLQYSARPDVTGLSWVEHRWSPLPGQASFGVYYTDENRLKAWLEAESQTAILTAIGNAANAAARATVYRDNAGLFPDHLFERLKDVVVDFASGEKGFRHAVSGSLRILNFYKIAAESASGARPTLTGLDLIVYGVPNADPPPRPTLTVAPTSPEAGENAFVAEATISLLAGTTLGQTFRLRRSALEAANVLKMPVVATGAMGALDTDTGLQQAVFRDDGPVQIADHARLKPWIRYSWVAEVQGAPESGSAEAGKAVPGRWSQASDPASLILIPAADPLPFTIDAIAGAAAADGIAGVALTLSHPDDLSGGAVGEFRVRISRRDAPGAPLARVIEATLAGASPFKFADDPALTVPFGAEYVVELVDPVGRVSPQAVGVVA